MSNNSNIQEKRNQLRSLSRLVKALMETGDLEGPKVNDALIEYYSEDGHHQFHTFKQWKESGHNILKGSKAFLVWGSPRQINHPDPDQEDDEFKYFPLCYLFSNLQVIKKEVKQQQEISEPTMA
jgi:hypothetical protein